ncbi:C40 family peptidase [Solirubrobacter sp. CPCC 204708]|uniref:C40 family peptidase n=1 Tax=Solirubrobacter deserti TaxID=2282478 RepID=A0ABT4RHW3_9ACTN|nr:C40 family peptidase [Solirubrobacter deserti]MBE2316595.1 C40 family peptidase [Solirubrobacter deserti]MDA0138127.1 C40 family peptidase [Solirubrobacter deserti]
MPRRSWRRLVPITALTALALPCAGASAAPLPADERPLPSEEARAALAAKVTTLRALVERREDRRRARANPEVVAVVKRQIGDGYAYGGSGPDGFDCSGLTMFAFARTGDALPHNSHAQAAMGKPVARDDIRSGDLVFFSTAGPGASHVGIATSGSTAVSATSSGGVMEHPIDDAYWGGSYVTARRID